ncbi:class I SAM-dependent methyltransferase [Candidatus Woesearchaeota archaeon]|nr:class I SAM-dependent methyltransferase [Candidatus Woesearchaeota archaeon]
MDRLTNKVKEHFDFVTPYYHKLWGEHIHHGYYITGKETKKEATERLLQIISERAGIPKKAKVLDAGSGLGGTAKFLAKNKKCTTIGITISPLQINAAYELNKNTIPKPVFMLQDANRLSFNEKFDAIIAIEVLSHLTNRKYFFKKAADILEKNGTISIGAWLKDADLPRRKYSKFIKPIEKGMVVNLPNINEYIGHFNKNNLRLIYYEDASKHVEHTWDITLDILKNPELWRIARKNGHAVIEFLKAFKAMKKGYASGAFRYGIIIAQKR